MYVFVTLLMLYYIGTPAGMYVLKTFPEDTIIQPEAFIQGSRELLEDVTSKFCTTYNTDVGIAYANEWIDFRDNVAPQSDSVEEWVQTHPLHIPFHDALTRGGAVHVSAIVDNPREQCAHILKNRPRKSCPLDYISWSRRGQQKRTDDPSLLLPNVVVEGPLGIDRFSVPVQCRPSKISVASSIASSNVRLPPLIVSAGTAIVDDASASASINEEHDNSESDAGSECTDSDKEEVDGWVVCHGTHNISMYGCARDCVGNTFTVPKQYMQKAFFSETCEFGKIHSIVRKAGAEDNDIYFKFYNHVDYPDDPPSDDSDCYCYVPCVDFMSSSVNRRKMEWDKSYYNKEKKKVQAPREKRSFWQMENVAPALFDQELDVDVSCGRILRSGRAAASDTGDLVSLSSSSSSSSSSASPTSLPTNSFSASSPALLPPIRQSRRLRSPNSSIILPISSSSSSSISPTVPTVSSSSSSPTLLPSLPPIHEQRIRLKKKIHESLVKKGLRKKESVEEFVELSECSDSNSDSDTSDSDSDS
jgi:hypothetical protein